MQTPIILAVVYILGMPIILRLLALAHKKLVTDKKIEKLSKNRASLKDAPSPIWPVWKERIGFTIKDKRAVSEKKPKEGEEPAGPGMTRQQLFFLLWGIGLVITVVAGFINKPIIIVAGVIMFFAAITFGIMSSKAILEAKKKVVRRMFDIARTKLGQSAEYESNPGAVVRVLEWADYIKPRKAEFDVPTAFNAEGGEESFMKQFNQIFGQDSAWVPSDDKETGEPGWNYEKGIVTIHAVPPLPTMAPWDEHYVLGEGIAWSFFPIALGVEGGVELPNPATGKIENVLGFDLSGLQPSEGKKFGIKTSPTITTSPMCLVGSEKILTVQGWMTIKGIAERKDPILVKTLNKEGDFVYNKMIGTYLTRKSANIVKVVFDDGSYVRCTSDHEWMISTGEYIVAEDLKSLYVKGYNQENLLVVSVESDGVSDVYDGEVEETHNFVVATNSDINKGIVSSNCFIGGGTGGGKSLSSDTLVEVIETA